MVLSTVFVNFFCNYNIQNYDIDLSITKPKIEFLKKRFRYRGAVPWNGISCEARTACSMDSSFQRANLN